MKGDLPAENRGKWLVGTIVVIGLIAALAGWRYRKLSPRSPAPPAAATEATR